MRSTLIRCVGLVPLLLFMLIVGICFAEDQGPTVAIDIGTSPVPDLSSIDSVYTGEADYVYAFLVIDDMLGGYVSGYDLGFELVSPDCSVINLGFNRLPGWVRLEPTGQGFPGNVNLPGRQTPTAVGFWKLALTNGSASSGEIRLIANPENLSSKITLMDYAGNQLSPTEVVSGSISLQPSSPVDSFPLGTEFTRLNCLGEPIPEPRTNSFVPGQVIARFAEGVIELPEGSVYGAIGAIQDIDVRRVGRKFRINLIERHYHDAARGDRWIESRTGELVKMMSVWDLYILHFPIDAPVWTIVDSLRAFPRCVYAEPNVIGVLCSEPNDSLYWRKHQGWYEYQWNIDNVRLPDAWDVQEGGDYAIGIGIFDSGIDYNHIDLGQGYGDLFKIRDGWNYIDNTPDFMDDADTAFTQHDSHGTMVAGVAGALTNNWHGVAGIAGGWDPSQIGCALYGIKISNQWAIVEVSALSNAIRDYSLNDRGVDVFNFSITKEIFSEDLREALYLARKAGRVVVACKDNGGSSDPRYPADLDYDWVICVGGVDRPGPWPDTQQRRHVANNYESSSGYGGGLDVLAPSVDLYTTARTKYAPLIYRKGEGNSGAAPHVSGIAALILSECDTLCVDDVEGVICGSCVDITTDPEGAFGLYGYDEWSGWGRVDAARALEFLHPPWVIDHFSSTGGNTVWTGPLQYYRFLGDGPLEQGWHYCRKHKVHCEVTYPRTYSDFKHVWGRGYGASTGWSGSFPSYQIGYCRLLPETKTSTGCTFEAFVYEKRDVLTGVLIGWYPCRPAEVMFAYSTLGAPCSGIEGDEPSLSRENGFVAVRPNPARRRAEITFWVDEPGEIRIRVFDVDGRLVRSIHTGQMETGTHTVAWDGMNDAHEKAPSGIYFCYMVGGGRSATKKVVWVR